MPPPSRDPQKPTNPPDGPGQLAETFLPSQDSQPSLPSSPSTSLDLPPELLTLKQYQILKELGAGGMGMVYLAKDLPLNRNVVIKVVKTERLHRSSAIERFTREMQAAARLNHTNVVTAYTSHQIGEFLVFVMEYVPGDDLSKLVKTQGRLAVTNAAYYIHQVSRGLQHAHENGLVHRDIKPSNLILNKSGKKHTVKILDFGLAKARSEDEEPAAGLTGMGKMLGTPEYVAPEQIRDASSADIRADLYSLGCTLYYLLAGEPPFRGRNEFELQEAHVFKTAKQLNLVRTEVPVELANIVSKLMAKEPAKRFQTPGEVVVALTPFLKGGLSSAGTGPQPVILLEEDNERSGEIKPKPPTAKPITLPVEKPTVSGGTTTTSPPIAKPVIATAMPLVTLEKTKTADKSGPIEQPSPAVRADDTKGSDDRRSRSTRVDDEPRRERVATEIKPHIWWLVWGYLQVVFLLLVGGVAALSLSPASKDSDGKTVSPTKGSSTKSTPTKDVDSFPFSSKKSESGSEGTTSLAGDPGRIPFMILEVPAILGLFYLLFSYSRPKSLVPPMASRWADRKWWIGSFVLTWLLGLTICTLFIGSIILMVVAFLVVLGLGAGIAVFLSRSSGGRPRYDDEEPDDRPRRQRDVDDRDR